MEIVFGLFSIGFLLTILIKFTIIFGSVLIKRRSFNDDKLTNTLPNETINRREKSLEPRSANTRIKSAMPMNTDRERLMEENISLKNHEMKFIHESSLRTILKGIFVLFISK